MTATVDGSPQTYQSNSYQGRWKIGAGILLAAIAAQIALWIYFAEDRTFSKMSVLFVWPAALFFLAIWWTFFSGQPVRLRLGVWSLIASALGVSWAIFAFEGVDGEMIPRFRYRWERSVREDVEKYFANQSAIRPAAPLNGEAEPLVAIPGDWPGFRGPQRGGIVTGVTLKPNWDARPPQELWRHPVGLGWSGFAVIGNYAFTQEQRGPDECVVCYQVTDGREIWVHTDKTRLEIVDANGGDGPHGTPQFSEGKLYTYGGTGLLNCLDARTGQQLWQANSFQDAAGPGKDPIRNVEWGASGSPLVIDHLVIVNPGGDQKRSLIAYDCLDGTIAWTAGDYPAGYASPHFATIHGVPQVIMFHGAGISAHDFVDGKQLWSFPWQNQPKVNAAQPIVFDDGTIVFGCGYGKGTVKIELRLADGGWQTEELWSTNRFRPKFNDFVHRNGFLYGLDDGILTCVDLQTGKSKWKQGRYGYGQLLLFDEVLLILSEQGELVQVEASPERHHEITRFSALDPICWNHFAYAHGKLLLRNGHVAACFEIEPVETNHQ